MLTNLSDHLDAKDEDPSAPWRYPQGPRFSAPLRFWCGLMVLVFLILTWITACFRGITLFDFTSMGWKLGGKMSISSSGYDLRFERSIPIPPPPPRPPGATCGTYGPGPQAAENPLCHALDWDRYQGFGIEVSRAHIDHWLLIDAQVLLWAGVSCWRRRSIRKAMAGVIEDAMV